MNPLPSETNELKESLESPISDIKVPLSDFTVNLNPSKISEFSLTDRMAITDSLRMHQIIAKIKQRKSKRQEASHKALKSFNTSMHEVQSLSITARLKNKLWWLISTFYITKKFIGNLRNSTIYRLPKPLKPYHFSLINDRSFFFNSWQQPNFIASCCLVRVFQFLKPVAFHPNHLFRICFDFLMMILTCFLFLAIPVCVGFNLDLNLLREGKIAILILFFLEILVNSNTAFLEKGELITDQLRILKKYLKHQFFFDFISFLTLLNWFFHLYLSSQMAIITHLVPLVFFLRVYNIHHLMNRYEDSVFLVESSSNKISFLKLIVFVLLFAHISACLWHYIGFSHTEAGRSWLIQAGILEEFWWMRYIYSLYYVVVVMNTIGFGDIVPTNSIERIFSIFFIYFGCSIFAYIINSIGIILQNINKNTREYKRKMYLINGFMKSKNIDFKTRSKVRNYLEYIYQEERNTNYEEVNQIIGKLSKDLKHELTNASHYEVIQNIPFFSKNFSDYSLQKISLELKELNFTPGDIIFQHYDISKPSIYIIRHGTVELYINNDATDEPLAVLKSLGKGDIFGHETAITGQIPSFSARSASFTTVFVIPQENLIQILKKNDFDFEIWCQIRDEIMNSDKKVKLYTQCASCHSELHFTRECPLINAIWVKRNIIARLNFSPFQERREFIRRPAKKGNNALKNLEFHMEKVEEIQSDFDFPQSRDKLNLTLDECASPLEFFSIDSINEATLEKEKMECSSSSKQLTPSRKDSKPHSSVIPTIPALENFEVMKEYCYYFPKDNVWDFIRKYTKFQNAKAKGIRRMNMIKGSPQRQSKGNSARKKQLKNLAQSASSLKKMQTGKFGANGKQCSTSIMSMRKIQGDI